LKGLALALLVFWIGRRIAKFMSNLTAKALTKAGNDPILVNFLRNLVYYIILVAVIIMALGQLGVQTTSLIAVMGAAGLAIGLALKDSLSNFASGVMLVMFRPFKLGDVVEVAGKTGKVQEIRIFSTIINTPDQKEMIVPNGLITADVITNFTAQKTRRVDLVIGVSYDDDIKTAKSIIEKTVVAHELVLKDPAPTIMVLELADSSINFAVRPWCKTEDYWTVYSDLLEQLKYNIEAGGCSFPYPQTDVHLHQAK
ncbi:MAG: mechanosensitive ion channel family protein, partial [Marinicella sp.]